MTLEQVKEVLAKLTLSPEIKAKVDELVVRAEGEGVTDEIKEEIAKLLEIEAEANEIEAETAEDLALALESFSGELEKATELASEEVEIIEEQFDKDTKVD